MWKVNTSNPGKILEFKTFLGPDIEVIEKDLAEPKADALTILRFKASQFINTIVDDTALEVEGAKIGTEVRWKLKDLKDWVGHEAVFVCLLGIQRENWVYVFEGRVDGRIVESRGDGFGFNPVFEPKGSNFTLAEKQVSEHNARYLAVESLKQNQFKWKLKPLKSWSGDFQTFD